MLVNLLAWWFFIRLTSKPKFWLLGTLEIVFDMCKQQRADKIQTNMMATLRCDASKGVGEWDGGQRVAQTVTTRTVRSQIYRIFKATFPNWYFSSVMVIIPVVGIRPERWYVAGRHSMAGPVNELTAIDADPRTPIRFTLLDTDSEKIRTDARIESKECCEAETWLVLPLSQLSVYLLVSTMSWVVSFIPVMV